VTFRLASKREPEIREITCPKCGTINQVKIGKYSSGIMTTFCKKCGEEIQLIYDRTLDSLELKHKRKEDT